ncbi:hypothetical protein MesoLjLc_45650 [Mesorhizobium sp. L-8-10]|uniref:hypothetical protein n=1 Tax=Mesorhizobium sp. L-8-10 TaxID=2744523 RepID=UPI00192696F1|nr:hypothetical protein [Mesorhizobium sp. L-8-10]BCH32635.1 hypothetical protein MesoLjLc_45650 [Mesorhizobium sp. L-8-10]
MADLTVQNLSDEDGGAVTFAAADVAGDKFVWDSRAAIVIKNDDVGSKTVTVTAAYTAINDATYGELTRSNIVLAVAAGAVAVIPPVNVAFRNAADLNKVALTYDAVTSLSVAVIRTH